MSKTIKKSIKSESDLGTPLKAENKVLKTKTEPKVKVEPKTETKVKVEPKTETKVEPKGDAKRKKHKHYSFESYLVKVLKSVHPEARISGETKSQLNYVMTQVAKTIATTVHQISVKKETIGSADIETALHLLLHKDAVAPAIIQGTKASILFEVSRKKTVATKKKKAQPKAAPITKSSRAGLIFPVEYCRKIMKGKSAYRMTEISGVYFAAVLEYIATDLCDRSFTQTADANRITIFPEDLLQAIDNDQVSAHLFRRLNIHIPCPDVKKEFANDPNIVQRKSPFERLIRSIAGDLRFTEGTCEFIQSIIEDKAVALFRSANRLTVHAGRNTIQPKDIELARILTNEYDEPDVLDEHTTLGHPGIHRLADKAGAEKVSSESLKAMNSHIVEWLGKLIHALSHLLSHNRTITVTPAFVSEACFYSGFPTVFVYKAKETSKPKSEAKTVEE